MSHMKLTKSYILSKPFKEWYFFQRYTEQLWVYKTSEILRDQQQIQTGYIQQILHPTEYLYSVLNAFQNAEISKKFMGQLQWSYFIVGHY